MMAREQILRYLGQVSDELEARGLHGEILLADGAVMCLVHEALDITKDIDALYEPREEINLIACDIALKEGLPKDWLNDSVKGVVGPNAQVEFISFTNLNILTVSAEYLLAMKMMASRLGEKDKDDMAFLVQNLGKITAEEAIDGLMTFLPASRVMPRTQCFIESIVTMENGLVFKNTSL
ncbi:MAG: hypothetical protein LBT59_18460 [Clostridiales bacterium]|jgi:hypothetical protein|nr:hypothetical protein [Clostridiales bacterium]